VLAWLRGLGYLDDEAYARDRARSLLGPGRAGPRLAERRLVAEGIAPPQARAAVAGALPEPGEEARRCRALAERRAGRPPRELDDRERARLARWLRGRGFTGGAVASALGVHVDDGEDR
jgi:regulatory protein